MRTAQRAVATTDIATKLEHHVAALLRCRRCPRMQSTPVSGGAIVSDVMIIGQAPGPREPTLKRPFAHTAGRTLFRWFEQFCGMNEAAVRSKIYFAAVCRCFPGKNSGGSDRVPAPDEIRILQPRLIIPVGRLAIVQFIDCPKLEDVIGRKFRVAHDDDAAAGVLNKNRNRSILDLALVDLRLNFIGDFVQTLAVGAHFKLLVVDVHFQARYSPWRLGQSKERRLGQHSLVGGLEPAAL